jgi:hypothetical protein
MQAVFSNLPLYTANMKNKGQIMNNYPAFAYAFQQSIKYALHSKIFIKLL